MKEDTTGRWCRRDQRVTWRRGGGESDRWRQILEATDVRRLVYSINNGACWDLHRLAAKTCRISIHWNVAMRCRLVKERLTLSLSVRRLATTAEMLPLSSLKQTSSLLLLRASSQLECVNMSWAIISSRSCSRGNLHAHLPATLIVHLKIATLAAGQMCMQGDCRGTDVLTPK
jgi:hypothetical protein